MYFKFNQIYLIDIFSIRSLNLTNPIIESSKLKIILKNKNNNLLIKIYFL